MMRYYPRSIIAAVATILLSTSYGYTQNLLANIPFDNGSTTLKGNTISGTVNGAITTTDRFGNPNSAYQFDGIDDYIDYGNNELFNLRDGFSLSAWFNTSSTKLYQTILGRGYSENGDYWLAIYNNGINNVIRFWLEGTAVNGTIPVPDGWNHVALVAETGTNNVIIYLNNEVYLNYTTSADLVGTSAYNLRIGNDDRDENYYFEGEIDDILIYSKPLTRGEIGVLSNAIPMDFAESEPEFGNALDFDGINDFILLPEEILGDSETGFTFETWVRWDSPNNNNRKIFYAGADFSDYFILDGDGLTALNGTNTVDSKMSMTLPIVNPNDDQWHHIAVSIDKVNNYAAIYLDGQLQSEAPNNISGPNPVNYPPTSTVFTPYDLGSQLYKATIGRDELQINYFTGKLDETRMWSVGRSAADIDKYLSLPVNPDQNELIYYFKYDQGIPSGDNRTIKKLTNSAGDTNGDLLGFNLNSGPNSNFFISSISNLPYAPIITGIYPDIVLPGDIITIYGANFIPLDGYNKVFIGGKVANLVPPDISLPTPPQSTQPNSIKVFVPQGTSGTEAVYIANGGGTSYVGSIQVQGPDANLPFDMNTNQIYSQLVSPRSIAYADIDENGSTDIVISGKNELIILYQFLNGFNASTVISVNAIVDLINVFDVDNDGDKDIIAYQQGNIVMYENTGSIWIESIVMFNPELGNIGSGETQQGGILNADFDGDGLIDLITRKAVGFGWLKNLGGGSFQAYEELNGENSYLGLAVGDVNNDRIIDIVASFNTWGGFENSPSKLHIFTNDGDGNLTKTYLGDVSDYGDNLIVADINKDDKLDIISANYNAPVRYWLNIGSGNYTEHIVPIIASMFHVEVSDLNADGFNDFIVTTPEKVIWAKNNGEASAPTFEEIIIEDEFFTALKAKPVDIDRDGDLDVLSISKNDNKVNLYEHLLSDNSFTEFLVSGQVGSSIINNSTHKISITVPYAFNRSNVLGQFKISKKAKISFDGTEIQNGSTTNNYLTPRYFTIESESGRLEEWEVSINPLPSIPVLTEVDDITQTEAEVEWEASDYALSYIVRLSDDDFDTYEDISTTELELILDLLPGTNYQLKIRAVNSYGDSGDFSEDEDKGFSEVEDFTTIPANPEPPTVSGIRTAAAVMSWSENKGTESYLLDVSKDSLFNEFIGGYNNRGVASLSESIIGLEAGKKYWARIRARNESGISDNSDTITFITVPAKPTLTVIRESQNEIEIQWPPLSGVEEYELEIFSQQDTSIQYLGDSQNSITFNALVPATAYGYRIRGVNQSGKSEWSNIESALTIPATPISMQQGEISNTSASIFWEEVVGTNGYLLEVSTDNFSTKLSGYNPKEINNASEVLLNLSGGVSYSYRIRSFNQSGESPYSEVGTFSTIPNSPVARSATSPTSTSFIANWDAVVGNYVLYTVELSQDANFIDITHTETFNETLSNEFTNLENGVSHWYRVFASNESGQSLVSNSILVEQPLQILDFTFSAEKTRDESAPSAIAFAVKGGRNNFSVSIRYKGILSNNWSNEIVLQPSNQQYEYSISNNMFDEIGIQFEVLVTDGVNSLKELDNYIYWTDTETELVSINLKNKWQLFSIPYQLEDNLIETLFDEMGPFEYKSEWRLMRYDDQKYVDAGEGINRIEMGKSYWFYTTSNVIVNIEGATVNTQPNVNLILEEGWNQIGNPYNIPISWSSVVLNNNESGNVESLFTYNSDLESFIKNDRMEAFSGGFVWSNTKTEVAVTLLDDSESARHIDPYEILSGDIDSKSWLVNIAIDHGAVSSKIAGIGMSNTASQSKDLFDQVALPRFVNYTEMYTTHDEYFYPYFSTDVRPNNAQESWLYDFKSNENTSLKILRWENEDFKFAKKQLWLINEHNGDIINMNSQNEYSFYSISDLQFSIHLTENISTSPVPFNIIVGTPYPNPTDDVVNFILGLPNAESQYDVLLTLFRLNGSRVKKITYKDLSSGVHKLSTPVSGQHLTSGMYYLELQVFGEHPFTRIEKIVIKD